MKVKNSSQPCLLQRLDTSAVTNASFQLRDQGRDDLPITNALQQTHIATTTIAPGRSWRVNILSVAFKEIWASVSKSLCSVETAVIFTNVTVSRSNIVAAGAEYRAFRLYWKLHRKIRSGACQRWARSLFSSIDWQPAGM